MTRLNLLLLAVLGCVLLAFPAGAQGNGTIEGEVRGNVTEEREEREERGAPPPGEEGEERDLRPLWYFLGALAVVGVAIGMFVMLREEP